MNNIIYGDCPRHGNGDPKNLDQLQRWRGERCVYCGKPKPNRLGPACNTNTCQDKRWRAGKPTEKQEAILRGIFEGKLDKEISSEIGRKIDTVKEHSKLIAKKFWVRRDRVLLARCYTEFQEYVNRKKASDPLTSGSPTGIPRKKNPPKRTALVRRL
jgi:hypothetical protein